MHVQRPCAPGAPAGDRNCAADAKTHLGQRPALPDGDRVALTHTETRRDVRGGVGVALLVPLVLPDEVEILPAVRRQVRGGRREVSRRSQPSQRPKSPGRRRGRAAPRARTSSR